MMLQGLSIRGNGTSDGTLAAICEEIAHETSKTTTIRTIQKQERKKMQR